MPALVLYACPYKVIWKKLTIDNIQIKGSTFLCIKQCKSPKKNLLGRNKINLLRFTPRRVHTE